MRLVADPKRRTGAERLAACIIVVTVWKVMSLQTSARALSMTSTQWTAIFGNYQTTAAAAAARRVADCRLQPPRRAYSAKELALQQERWESWQAGHAQGIAMCLSVKDQAEALPEWVEYHISLGVSHIYVYDTGSRPPVKWVLKKYREAGTVTYHYIRDFEAASRNLNATNDHKYNPKYKQWIAYSLCLRDHGKRHHYMAFIDSDEYFVITDGTASLPDLMADYEQYGGLAANWRIMGSSGHLERQRSTLLGYTSCYPEQEPEQLAIKSIVNTALAVQPASPHNAFYVGSCHAVSTAGEPVEDFASKHIRSERLLVYHYVTKSLEDFKEKMERGGGLGVNFRDMDYWDQVQAQSTETCTAAADAWQQMTSTAAPQQHNSSSAVATARRLTRSVLHHQHAGSSLPGASFP
ncbi:hypothetical protein D9Q98_000151 [Chlorella vulgaris]|uniref:Glycosyltransferase family 92 protein n=1 Tax=Chlorella vulgaris TaxID=3077 RepID=A0A9D4TXU3_CHLVU|nr:hypothetical protein D9Q98_000151 [Chlorella vulgaris]